MEKADLKQIDGNILDELIGMCENRMIHPFKKKKVEVAAIVEPEAKEEVSESKPDLSDMDVEELLEMYKEMQDKKEEA